jgi:sodium-dependent dicarboxylate transporter 2/3/5
VVVAESVRPGGTYKTLAEQREVLSPAEERFERLRQTSGLFLGPLVLLVLYFAPLGLEYNQRALAAVFAFVVVYWITEAIPIPVTALLGIAMSVLLLSAPIEAGSDEAVSDIVFASFGDSVIFLIIGAFIIAEAMMRHGLDRRFAFWMLSLPGVNSSTWGLIVGFGLVAMAISAFISNTAATAMLLPIGLGIMGAIGRYVGEQSGEEADPRRLRLGTAVMLMSAYGAVVGGLLTPVGSPTNFVGIGFIEEQIGTNVTFFEWVITAAPIAFVAFAFLCVILIALNRPEVRRISGTKEYVDEERRKLGPMSRAERNTLLVFAVAVALWVLPGVVALVFGDDSALYATVLDKLNEGVVAIVAAALLFVLPVDWGERRFTMNWNEAVRIDWGTVILFGAGITLGSLLSKTGLAQTIGETVAGALGFTSLIGITALGVVVGVLVSETASNTASATVVVPIIIPIAQAAGVDPLVPALATTFACSFGFMLPVSTPPNAVAYGSGLIPITKMVRTGGVFDVVAIVLVVLGTIVMTGLVGLS